MENKLKISVGNDTYSLTNIEKKQTIDKTTTKAGNTGGYLLPQWKIISKSLLEMIHTILPNIKTIQTKDKTTMKAGNTGRYILPYWKNICNDKNNSG